MATNDSKQISSNCMTLYDAVLVSFGLGGAWTGANAESSASKRNVLSHCACLVRPGSWTESLLSMQVVRKQDMVASPTALARRST